MITPKNLPGCCGLVEGFNDFIEILDLKVPTKMPIISIVSRLFVTKLQQALPKMKIHCLKNGKCGLWLIKGR